MSIETTAIQRLTERVKLASVARARDLRMDVNELMLLTAEITSLLARLVVLEHGAAGQSSETTASMDGGSLR